MPRIAILVSMLPNNSSQSVPPPSVTRRQFLVTSSAVLASAIAPANAPAIETSSGTPKLALNGGDKAVKHSTKLPIRWGEPERDRLNAMLAQDSLFYWKGPQTTLLVERFKSICPCKYVMPCS